MTKEEKETIKIGDSIIFKLNSENKYKLNFNAECIVKRYYDNNGMFCLIHPNGSDIFVHTTEIIDNFDINKKLPLQQTEEQSAQQSEVKILNIDAYVNYAIHKFSNFLNDERFDYTEYVKTSKFSGKQYFSKETLLNDFKEFIENN